MPAKKTLPQYPIVTRIDYERERKSFDQAYTGKAKWYWEMFQCENHQVPGAQFALRAKTRRCKHTALFHINGLKLCQLHTGRELLKIALGEEPET